MVYPDLEKLNEASAQFDTANDEVTARIAAAGSCEERIKVQRERYEQAGE